MSNSFNQVWKDDYSIFPESDSKTNLKDIEIYLRAFSWFSVCNQCESFDDMMYVRFIGATIQRHYESSTNWQNYSITQPILGLSNQYYITLSVLALRSYAEELKEEKMDWMYGIDREYIADKNYEPDEEEVRKIDYNIDMLLNVANELDQKAAVAI